jgi:threonine/homoserine/homoserine lactone efflux protein
VVDGIRAFLTMTLLLSVSPGPDDVLVLRSSLAGGPRLGLATIAGVASGSRAWGAATAVGLAAVVTRSAPVYQAIRLAGAGYLVLLGVAPLLAGLARRTRRASPAVPVASGGQPAPPGGVRSAFAVGVMSDLLNPKIGLFYVAVIPRFVPPRAPVLQYSILLCVIDIAVAVTWLGVLTWLAHTAVAWLLRPPVVCWSRRIFSTFLIALGVSTAVGL